MAEEGKEYALKNVKQYVSRASADKRKKKKGLRGNATLIMGELRTT